MVCGKALSLMVKGEECVHVQLRAKVIGQLQDSDFLFYWCFSYRSEECRLIGPGVNDFVTKCCQLSESVCPGGV